MEDNLFEILKKELLKINDFNTQKGNLNFPLIQKMAFDGDNSLLDVILGNERLKHKFFIKNKDTLIYNRDLFLDFIGHKNFLANSYTKFSNKIGLAVGNRFLKQNNDVVLNFPFKDCVLEGGQTKDDKKQNELFFNEILASDEIDRLFDKKIFTNFKRFGTSAGSVSNGSASLVSDGLVSSVSGVALDTELAEVSEIEKSQNNFFSKDENGNIKDNLIIKGNNLIALHSIKERFRGKVKLIYIDPPYNTGNDSFNYNDNFNHSTWLTFMKNRLEVARQLLRDDGVIFVSIDDNEHAYLKVLMDEIFGRENFVGDIIRKTGSNRNMGNIGRSLDVRHENLTVFSKKNTNNIFYGIQQYVSDNEIYTQDFTVRTGGFEYEIPSLDFSIKFKKKWSKKEECLKKMLGGDINSSYEELYKNIEEIKGLGWFKLNDFIFKSKNGIINKIKDKKDKKLVHSLWIDIESQKNVNSHFEELQLEFSNPKLESFIQRIIEISTQPSDIVLDYHLGSGTTCAVAHKIGRQYIGIEQMDYIETIAVERLKKVIEGEQGGISKSVNWQGGGDFVYMELKENTAQIINKITKCSTKEELQKLKKEILDYYLYIDYKVKVEFLKKEDKEFEDLDLETQKKILISIFDKNQLYISYTERNDDLFSISEEEKKLSEEFYSR